MAGRGNFRVACQVFADLGVEDVALVGISKGPDRDAGREHFYMPGKEPFRLDPKSPVLYYLQRLRDEAHRFAIGSHRKKRSAAIGANPLDEIAGVGAGRKRALLQHFGSARAVAAASLADLQSVAGVSETLARKSSISSTPPEPDAERVPGNARLRKGSISATLRRAS